MLNNKVYSNIYALLLVLGNDFISRIPNDLFCFIKENRDLGYVPIIDVEKSIHQQLFDKTTMAFITMLKLNYWCESPEEKTKLLAQLQRNEDEFDKIKLDELISSYNN